ncbi:hypothetical protein Hdeb2414_s0011g00375661 [Helianthus debilis subsp. tardiflorus]
MDFRRHSRRSKSFPSSTTISDDPSATLSTPLHYLSIPFSWEKFPGIPKNNNHNNDDSSQNLLPLPPSSHSPTMKKYSGSRSFRNDPFLAAFVECSKDKEFEMESGGERSKRPTSDRSGFVVSMYSSCKRSCAVSESIVYRPRSSTGYILATDQDLSVAKSKP